MENNEILEDKASEGPESQRLIPKTSALQPEAPSFEDDEEEDFFWRARCTDYSLSGRFEFFGHRVDYAEVTRA